MGGGNGASSWKCWAGIYTAPGTETGFLQSYDIVPLKEYPTGD